MKIKTSQVWPRSGELAWRHIIIYAWLARFYFFYFSAPPSRGIFFIFWFLFFFFFFWFFFFFFFFFFSTNQQAQQNISLITKLFFHLTVFLVIVVIKFLLSIFSPTFLDRTLRCCLLRVPRSSPGRPQVPTIVKRIKLLSIIMRSWQADRADL